MARGNFGGFLPPLNSIADGALFSRHVLAIIWCLSVLVDLLCMHVCMCVLHSAYDLMFCFSAQEMGKARFVGVDISCYIHSQHYSVHHTVHIATCDCSST